MTTTQFSAQYYHLGQRLGAGFRRADAAIDWLGSAEDDGELYAIEVVNADGRVVAPRSEILRARADYLAALEREYDEQERRVAEGEQAAAETSERP